MYDDSVSNALQSAVTAMRTLAESSRTFTESIRLLKAQKFTIGSCWSPSYKATMLLIQIAFPGVCHKTRLNKMCIIKKTLKSPTKMIDLSDVIDISSGEE